MAGNLSHILLNPTFGLPSPSPTHTSTSSSTTEFDVDASYFNESGDLTEFVFHSMENNRSEETTVAVPEYVAMTSLVLCSVVLAVGVLGNLLVIVVILTNKLLRSSTNLFLLNLSVADLLVLVTCTPTSLVEITTGRDAWILGKVSFKTFSFFSVNGIFL